MRPSQLGTGSVLVPLFLALFGSALGQSFPGEGQGAMWTAPGNLGSTPAVIHADAFPATIGDACQRINAAWSALPTTGGTIDARGFTGTQACSINPFNGVTQSGILLLGNATYSVAVPWTIPPEVRVYGSGRGSDTSTPNPGTSLQATFSPFSTTGSVSIPANSASVTATTGTPFTSSMVGALFFATDGTTTVQSTILFFTDSTHITLSMAIGSTALTTTSSFSITPAVVQFNATASGSTSFGISISNLQVDCGSLAHGIGVQNWWAEELSYAQDVNLSNCVGIALDVETTSAQNSGPYVNIAVGQSGGVGVGAPVAQTLCAELFNTGDLRGIHGLTCTSTGIPAVGVDLNTPSATLEDAHFEGYTICVEVGSHSGNANRSNGLNIINLSGGSSSGTGSILTLVDILNDPSVGGSTDINVFGLAAPASTSITNLLNDHIMGTIVPFSTEKSLAFYVLGRVLNAGGGRVRLTSSPNSSNAPNVMPSIAQAYTKGSTFTAQNLGCFSAGSTVSDCPLPNNQFVGVNLPSSGSLALVQTAGDAMVTLDGTRATVAVGDFICVSGTAGKAVDVGNTIPTSCPYGSGVGIAAQAASGNPTVILVHLRYF